MRIKTYYIGIALAGLVAAVGCKKSFFDRPPENATTVGSYYQTEQQVLSSTNILYSAPWFGLNGKAFLAIGDLQSGNAICFAGADGSFDALGAFGAGSSTQTVESAWNALYTVIAQANALINNLSSGAASSVDDAIVNNAIGEARVMRALAYFYLVRIFGNVPIITDPTQLVNSFDEVHTNPITDVYKFIVQDLQFGEANCTPGTASTGHVSSSSAAGLLAKVYLYMQDYDNAKNQAEKVINSGEFGLVGLDAPGEYVQMFEMPGNNGPESMVALQWTSNSGYGYGNQIQSVVAPNGTITGTGDGWAQIGPSLDLQQAYADAGDVIRRHGTIMVDGDFYPELTKKAGGYHVSRIDNGNGAVNAQSSGAGVKKYVVGTPDDNGGLSAFQATSVNTVLLRFSEMYLIAAEAILGKSAGVQPGQGIGLNVSTSDATALGYINKIRQRAGISTFSGSFTYAQLLYERRMEYAFEGDYWYDLQRIDGYVTDPATATHPVASAMINAQDRRTVNVDSDTGEITGFNDGRSFTLTDKSFILPIPAQETTAVPTLLEAPVPYEF